MNLCINNEDFDCLFIPSLRVEKLDPSQYRGARKIAQIWVSVAKEKNHQATSLWEKTQFTACANMAGAIRSELDPSWFSTRSIYVCKDHTNTIQAFMSVDLSPNEVYIAYLVTNPKNIRSSLNDHEVGKVKGAGTALLQMAEKIAQETGRGTVKLTPLESAVSFYKKMGFVEQDWYLIKTVSKIQSGILPTLLAA
jgi:hypothetical protein